MKKILLCLSTVLISTFSLNIKPLKSQTIDFDSKQNFTISAPGFFPFSTTANSQFKDVRPMNPNLTVQFSNFLGNLCAVAPAADFSEIGPQIVVRANGDITLDFSNAQPTANQFGLSLVPQGGSCIFDLFIPKPQATLPSPTPTPEVTISLPPGEDALTPNALTIFSNYVPDDLANELSNEKDNIECKASLQGLTFISVLSGDTPSETVFVTFLGENTALKRISKITRFLNSNNEENSFTIVKTTPKQSMTVYSQNLFNSTDKTKVFVTGIYPSFVKELTTSIGLRTSKLSTTKTPKNQSSSSVSASIQHAVVSVAMPWQVSDNGGFFITKGGGCVGPLCTIVESGMVLTTPGGSCTQEKVTKRRTLYETITLSKLFNPFASGQKTVQIPLLSNIINPNHPKSSATINTSNGYLIFQPVPPNSKIKQLLNISVQEPCPNPVKCDNLCSNIGTCCQADKNGFAVKTCQQFMGGQRCTCLP